MASKIPITLKGPNLGERHRYLNSLVTEAHKTREPFEMILESTECSPVDRLFKINLASKQNHLEYILKNLQDEDMLYVSQALKSTWLLEEQYRHIINPDHLESALYPHMITTAVNKMKHWINLNLRDSVRCLEFYEYYSKTDADYAFKFLSKCPGEIILREFPKTEILDKITPHRLKVLCEKTPGVAKLFYELLTENKSLLKKHRGNEQEYFNKIKCILKTNTDFFMDITERHFLSYFKRLSTNSTKFILINRKDRFMQKPELYTARILDVNAVAQCLTPDESENLVIQLARARYLNDQRWFNYKNVEPLVKKLDFTKRASFKKKVFVDKDIGESVIDWPYAVPKNIKYSYDDDIKSVFLEVKESNHYDDFATSLGYPRFMKLCCESSRAHFLGCVPNRKTLLDALFEEYRFSNFDKTLFELRKKLKCESSSQNRMHMFLVLVSKSGGRSDNLDALFHLLMKFKNEPAQVRAAVIRSLVKRGSVWRVTENIWKSLLIFGQGLGLDGNVPEAECAEGIHAVVIRALLSSRDCEPAIKAAFIKHFSTFSDYSLAKDEKEHIKKSLLNMLVESANEEIDAKTGAQILEYAIDTLQAYNIKFETRPDLTAAIKKLLRNDPDAGKCLLQRLFRSKLGRKELYRENFDLVQTDASYVNALKHDISILSVDKFLKAVVFDELIAEQFLRKMSIYFNGNEDLAGNFLTGIKEAKIHKNLARPITYLISDGLKSYMLDLDSKDVEYKRFSGMMRANAHVARPAFHLDALEWQKAGVKLISNKVIICKAVDIDGLIKKLLTWSKTARLAIILAQRTSYEADTFAAVAQMRPTIALKTALTYFRRRGDQFDNQIWEIVKTLMGKVKANQHLIHNIRNVDSMPISILPEYLVEAFKVISEIDFNKSLGLLFRIKLNLPKVNAKFIEDILKSFLENRLVLDKVPNNEFCFEYDMIAELYLSIFAKYLLLCKNEDSQNVRLKNVGQLYLDRLQTFWEAKTNKKRFFKYLSVISRSLRYTEVFLKDEYVSCLPVMEMFVVWMRGFIPLEKHFVDFVPFHLNMLYYKTIRQAVEQIPGLFDDKQRRDEGYKMFGETFGTYVGQEARVLTKNYFDSIVMLYQVGLTDFFKSFNKERFRVAPHIIIGIINASDGIECTVALDLYKNLNRDELFEHEKVNILNCFRQKNLIEMQFCHDNWPRMDRYHYWTYH